jgi:hypothetical protein
MAKQNGEHGAGRLKSMHRPVDDVVYHLQVLSERTGAPELFSTSATQREYAHHLRGHLADAQGPSLAQRGPSAAKGC